MPFVALGRSESALPENRWVDLDFEGIAERAVLRLYERGHRRIAIAARRRTSISADFFLKAIAQVWPNADWKNDRTIFSMMMLSRREATGLAKGFFSIRSARRRSS